MVARKESPFEQRVRELFQDYSAKELRTVFQVVGGLLEEKDHSSFGTVLRDFLRGSEGLRNFSAGIRSSM